MPDMENIELYTSGHKFEFAETEPIVHEEKFVCQLCSGKGYTAYKVRRDDGRIFNVGMDCAKNYCGLKFSGKRPIYEPIKIILSEDAKNKHTLSAKPEIDLSGIKVGIQVTHKEFGNGTVLSLDGDVLIVDFNSGEKKLLLSYSLEKGFLRIYVGDES